MCHYGKRKNRTYSPFPKLLLNIVLLCIFLFAIIQLVTVQLENRRDQQAFAQLAEQIIEPTTSMPKAEQLISGNESIQILAQYQDLYEQNTDLAGWITIEDTILNYPVMYSPKEPEFYLRKDFQKEYSISGTPFIGNGCSINPRSENLLIYGHNMQNGSMFHLLLSYEEETFWQDHPIVQFDTLYEKGTYEIFAAFHTDVTVGSGHFPFYQYTDLESDETYDAYTRQCLEHSLYDTGITPQPGDSLITLVTCSYHSDNGRFVVVARKQSPSHKS